jgi:hypothetical protein
MTVKLAEAMKNEEEFEPKGSVIPYWNYCSSQNSID